MLPSAFNRQLTLTAMLVLLLAFTLPIIAQAKSSPTASQPLSNTSHNVTITSTSGWQSTLLTVNQGDQYTISYNSGQWTVDVRNWPKVGPQGYIWDVDQQIFQGCKYDSTLTYATLLGEIGSGPDFAVGKGGVFTASASGTLSLRINDSDACLADNVGSIKLTVSNGASGINVNVDGTQSWTNTGIDLSQSDTVYIRASAIIWFASGFAVPYGPDGKATCTAGSGFPGQGLHCYSLIGMIGSGTPFQLGSSTSFTASATGRLYLGVNDNVFSDNSGSWQANMIVHTALPIGGNYSGYVATGTQNNTLVYSDVTATWTVPTISCGFGEFSQSATWVSLGDNNTDLEQVGTANTCVNGGPPTYLAVWQVYQNGQSQGNKPICTNCITGGDKVKSEVQFVSLGQFHFTFWNLTRNKQWSITVSGDNTSKATALGECIEEVPQGATLSNFGSVTITCQANLSNPYPLPIGSAGDSILQYTMPQTTTGNLNASGTGATFTIQHT